MKNWVALAQNYLQNLHTINALDIDALKDIIDQADNSYYVQDKPVLADAEYDTLFAALKKLENQNPALLTADSPTQRVAKGLTNSFKNVDHLVPMLSLENSYDLADLLAWDVKCKEACSTNELEYCIEPKYDGASLSIIYEEDILVRGATRGNGVIGDEITSNTKQIKTIPLHAPLKANGIKQLEIRGEVVITKAHFEAHNTLLRAQGLAPMANARNAASGALRMKDVAEVAKRNLHAIMYHVSYVQYIDGAKPLDTHLETLQLLQTIGIKSSSAQARVFNNIQDVYQYCQQLEAERDTLPFDIDGMVIKVNNYAQQDLIGQTSHHPKWAIAYKFKARQATSKLLAIEYQVGRTGAVTPVAKITPVSVGGVTVSSISVHNQDNIVEKDLRLGDTILIERAGDVIPYLVQNFPELRDGTEQLIVFPSTCPVCHSVLEKPLTEAVWRCTNFDCSAQVVERIIHFASKDAMDIRGLGDANIRKFFELGLLNNIADIYNLPYAVIAELPGMGSKSIEKLEAAIEQSKQQSLAKFIYGLGIRHVGETTAKTLSRKINELTEIYNLDVENLKLLEDIGDKVAESIVQFFALASNRQLIEQLQAYGLGKQIEKASNAQGEQLTGKTFLFTGTLSKLKRSAAEQMVESLGGTILGSVSTKLHYLVVGADAGSKLEKAKKLNTVNIISEDEFCSMVENL